VKGRPTRAENGS